MSLYGSKTCMAESSATMSLGRLFSLSRFMPASSAPRKIRLIRRFTERAIKGRPFYTSCSSQGKADETAALRYAPHAGRSSKFDRLLPYLCPT